MSMAQIQIIGHVGRDPELTVTSEGIPVTKFSLATSERKKDEDITTWWACTAWRNQAEVIEKHVVKGQELFVQGKLTVRNYTTREGKQGTSLDVLVERFVFIGGKKAQAGEQNASTDGDPFLPDFPDNVL
jgi:single-strand DNA-binding protein